MAETRKLTLRPRAGRGLLTAFNPQSMAEEWLDSFLEFEDLYIRESGWCARQRENFINYESAEHPIRSQHAFNKVTSTTGSMSFKMLIVGNSKLYDTTLSLLESLSSPYEMYFETVKNRTFFAGANNTPQIYDGTSIVSWGAAGPTTDLTYHAYTDATNTATKVSFATCTAAGTTVTWVSGTKFTTGASWEQKPIYIGGVLYRIATVTNDQHLELTAAYTGGGGNQATVVHYGELSWTIPPRYAYAYYNPTTGHITNASPVLTLSEQNVKSVRVAIRTIATDPTLYAMGYTKIVLFRSRVDGTDMLDLYAETTGSSDADGSGYLNNKNTLTSLDYDDEGPDTRLGIVIGANSLPTVNNPPPRMRFIAYWDGRFWGVEEARQWRLRFSGDANTIPLGVAEECWPELFYRDITSGEGYVTGLKVVGSTLMIMTTKYTYYIVGNSYSNYSISRLSTRGFGVSANGIDEHPGDSTTESASAIYVSRDKRLWRHYEGGRIEDIGAPIQDKLDATPLGGRHPFMVRVVRLEKLWLLVLGMQSFADGPYRLLFYDFDAQAWYDWGYYSNLIDIGDVVGYAYLPSGSDISGQTFVQLGRYYSASFAGLWLGNVNNYLAHWKTQHLDHGDRTAYKQHEAIWVYVNDKNLYGWGVSTYYDEETSPVAWTRQVLDSGRDPGGNIIAFTPPAVKQWKSCSYRLDVPGPLGRAYRFEAFFRNLSTGSTGEPS